MRHPVLSKRTLHLKSIMLAVASVALVSAGVFALSGCSSTAGSEVSDRVSSLEARVKALEDKVIAKADDARVENKTYSEAADFVTYERELADFERAVSAAADASTTASVPSDSAQKMLAYNVAVEPLEDLEIKLGELKSAYEAAHANGNVSDHELIELNAYTEKVYADLNMAIENVMIYFGLAD